LSLEMAAQKAVEGLSSKGLLDTGGLKHKLQRMKSEWKYRVKFVPHPTEPADYTSFHILTLKEVITAYTKISQCRNARIVVTGTIIVALATLVTTTMKLLLSMGISEEAGLGK
jgi:hypothetical protein